MCVCAGLRVETGIECNKTSMILLSCQGKIKTHKYFRNSQGLRNGIREDKKVSEKAECAWSQRRWSMSGPSGGPCGP